MRDTTWVVLATAVAMFAMMGIPAVYHLILRLRRPKQVCFISLEDRRRFLLTACGNSIWSNMVVGGEPSTKDVTAVTCRACLATDAYHAALNDAIDWPAILAAADAGHESAKECPSLRSA